MRAVGVTSFGGPEALEVIELPEPHAGEGEVRIRVHAAAVNPTDTLLRSGARAKSLASVAPPPYVPGMDAAGVVDEIGAHVEAGFAVGDHVMAIVMPHGSHGAYSEYLALPADSVVRVPDGASDVEAASLPMNALTARRALDQLALPAGATIAVTGAAGAFGGYVVQLAKTDGLRVVADATPADEVLVASLGADVLVPRGEAVGENIRAEVPDGVDGLADGALNGPQALAGVRDGGGFAAVRAFEGESTRDITVHRVWVGEYARDRAALERLRRQVEDGAVTLRVARSFPAEQAAEAHRLLEAGGTRGRLVLEF